jgi:hypothetical protein
MANDLRTFFGVEPPSRDPKNRRERIEQELELIKDVFGDKTKDQSRERAMNLAMIGLAIAAGQSPNAITNIAQGALAGTQAMQRAQASAAKREDALRMQAFETVLAEDQRAQTLADKIGLERLKASLKGSESEIKLSPVSPPLQVAQSERSKIQGELADVLNPLWDNARGLSTEERDLLTEHLALSRSIRAGSNTGDPAIERQVEVLRQQLSNLPELSVELQQELGRLNDPVELSIARATAKIRREPLTRDEVVKRLKDGGIPEQRIQQMLSQLSGS